MNLVVRPVVYESLSRLPDAQSPVLKRRRVSSDLIVVPHCKGDGSNRLSLPRRPMEALPDECLYNILGRLAGRRERSISACVSKRWLLLLSTIRCPDQRPVPRLKLHLDLNETPGDYAAKAAASGENYEWPGRSFKGDATDVSLAAAAIGAGSCHELQIQGGKRGPCRVTDVGLTAIARGFPSLKVFSMWGCHSVGDEGLAQIAVGCPLLEKLDLRGCPAISDLGIAAVALRCPKLSTLTLESCKGVGDEGLRAIGRACPALGSISVTDCPLVGDRGIAGLLVSSHPSTVQKIELNHLNVSDASLAVVGIYGTSVTDLALASLQNVTERGFWAMASAGGLQMLNYLSVASCHGLTDLSLEVAAKGFPLLKQVKLRSCNRISEAGLKSFAPATCMLERLQLEDCWRVSLQGALDAILSLCSISNGRALHLARDVGMKDCGSCPGSRSSHSIPSRGFLSVRHSPSLPIAD